MLWNIIKWALSRSWVLQSRHLEQQLKMLTSEISWAAFVLALIPLLRICLLSRGFFLRHRLSIHNLKTVVKRDEGSARRMAPPECEARLARQRALLRGIDITGPLQPAHGLYDLCTSMIEKNEISYISPTRCLSTNRNLQGLSQIRNYSLMPRRQLSFWRSSSPRWKFRWPRTWLCITPFKVIL